jgi:putative Mg2+ transporter-C (MgtC) family protein
MTPLSELEIVIRIIAAIALGGAIGLERELTGHSAGLRTNMLVALGAALFMIAAIRLTEIYAALNPAPDPSRIASTIVTGISFLGAGVIFQSRTRIRNLTTAASIWVVAAIGMLVGSGFYIAAGSGTLITIVVLWALTPFEEWLARRIKKTPAGRAKSNQLPDDLDDE